MAGLRGLGDPSGQPGTAEDGRGWLGTAAGDVLEVVCRGGSKGVVRKIQKTSQNKDWSVFGKDHINFSRSRMESVREW